MNPKSIGLVVIQFLVLGLAFLLISAPPARAEEPEALPWIQLEAEGFDVYSSLPAKNSRTVLHELLLFREGLAGFLPTGQFHSPFPTRIFLFGHHDAYEHLRSHMGESERTVGVFFQSPEANVMVVDLSAGLADVEVVFHEYVHFVNRHTIPRLPLWANEGLAEFFSTFEVRDDELRVGHPIARYVETLEKGRLMSLAELTSIDHDSSEYRGGHRRGIFYAESWGLVHMLLTTGAERRAAFSRFCSAIQNGASADEAMAEHLPLDESTTLREMTTRVKSRKMPALKVESDLWSVSSIAVAEPEEADVLVQLGMLLVRQQHGNLALARRHFEKGLLLRPDFAPAHLGLALEAVRSQEPESARDHFERATRLAPGDPDVLNARGEWLLDEFRASLGTTPLQMGDSSFELTGAREMFSQCLAVDATNARASAGYALTFQIESKIPVGAMQALERATRAYPDREDLVMFRCLYLAREGHHADAWQAYHRNLVGLRPSPELLAFARRDMVHDALDDAIVLAETESVESGRALLEQVLHQASDTGFASEVRSRYEEASAFVHHNAMVDRFNEGVDAANAGELDRASKIFEEVAAAAADSSLRDAAATILEDIRARQR